MTWLKMRRCRCVTLMLGRVAELPGEKNEIFAKTMAPKICFFQFIMKPIK